MKPFSDYAELIAGVFFFIAFVVSVVVPRHGRVTTPAPMVSSMAPVPPPAVKRTDRKAAPVKH